METAKLVVSILAVVLALASFVVAQHSAAKARRAEDVRNLLGDKETVAFGALKVLRDGLPPQRKSRELLIGAILQACIFERSDRARALLYRVMERERVRYGSEFRAAYQRVEETFTSMSAYGFTPEELDLRRGTKYLNVVKKVLDASFETETEEGMTGHRLQVGG
ncbi:hypothetical protein SAMN04488107_2005 [Geodermatophilus saharensis]|uniref:Uncharacterized protein n=1 Tax=Geodermatophilus saharensis TaxID=1137994 RepID=A0A239D6N1_9ACTN|nr:hypothetical protein SAMN04488107_2005 [Geodermatophilus saharensis]